MTKFKRLLVNNEALTRPIASPHTETIRRWLRELEGQPFCKTVRRHNNLSIWSRKTDSTASKAHVYISPKPGEQVVAAVVQVGFATCSITENSNDQSKSLPPLRCRKQGMRHHSCPARPPTFMPAATQASSSSPSQTSKQRQTPT